MPPDGIARGEKCRRIVMTVLWFGVSLLLAVIVPNIGVVIALLGGLAAVFVFIFPGQFFLLITSGIWIIGITTFLLLLPLI